MKPDTLARFAAPQGIGVGRAARPALALAGVVALAAVARIWGLDRHSLWLDEAFSYHYSGLSLHDIWRVMPLYESHPPVYFTILKAWRAAFGDGEAAMRGLSVAAGTATVPLVYLLGRLAGGRRDGHRIGAFAALLFAISPLHLDFAQQARPYALIILATATTLCGVAWLLRHPAVARSPWLGLAAMRAHPRRAPLLRRGLAAWAATALGVAAALWLHDTVLVYAAALGLFGLWLAWRWGWPRSFVANLMIAGAAALALWLPFLPTFAVQLAGVSRAFWMPDLTWQAALAPVGFLMDVRFVRPLTAAPVLVLLALAGARGVAGRSGAPMAALLIGVAVAGYGLMLLFCLLVQTVLVERTLIWMSVPLLVLVAAGVVGLERRALRAASAVVVLGFSIWGALVFQLAYQREPWRDIAARIGGQAVAGDVVVVMPNSLALPLAYYRDRLGDQVAVHAMPAAFPEISPDRAYPTSVLAEPAFVRADLPALDAAIAGAGSVWVITRLDDIFDPDRLVLGHMRQVRTETEHWPVSGYLHVHRFR